MWCHNFALKSRSSTSNSRVWYPHQRWTWQIWCLVYIETTDILPRENNNRQWATIHNTEYDRSIEYGSSWRNGGHTSRYDRMHTQEPRENEDENREILLIKVQITVLGNVHCHKRKLHYLYKNVCGLRCHPIFGLSHTNTVAELFWFLTSLELSSSKWWCVSEQPSILLVRSSDMKIKLRKYPHSQQFSIF